MFVSFSYIPLQETWDLAVHQKALAKWCLQEKKGDLQQEMIWQLKKVDTMGT